MNWNALMERGSRECQAQLDSFGWTWVAYYIDQEIFAQFRISDKPRMKTVNWQAQFIFNIKQSSWSQKKTGKKIN